MLAPTVSGPHSVRTHPTRTLGIFFVQSGLSTANTIRLAHYAKSFRQFGHYLASIFLFAFLFPARSATPAAPPEPRPVAVVATDSQSMPTARHLSSNSVRPRVVGLESRGRLTAWQCETRSSAPCWQFSPPREWAPSTARSREFFRNKGLPNFGSKDAQPATMQNKRRRTEYYSCSCSCSCSCSYPNSGRRHRLQHGYEYEYEQE